MKSLIKLLPVALLTFFVISCDKDDDPARNPNVAFAAILNGASEVPANPSAASGSATATYNMDTNILTVVTTYSGVTPIAGHIHKGAVGVSGDIVFPFPNFNFTYYPNHCSFNCSTGSRPLGKPLLC